MMIGGVFLRNAVPAQPPDVGSADQTEIDDPQAEIARELNDAVEPLTQTSPGRVVCGGDTVGGSDGQEGQPTIRAGVDSIILDPLHLIVGAGHAVPPQPPGVVGPGGLQVQDLKSRSAPDPGQPEHDNPEATKQSPARKEPNDEMAACSHDAEGLLVGCPGEPRPRRLS